MNLRFKRAALAAALAFSTLACPGLQAHAAGAPGPKPIRQIDLNLAYVKSAWIMQNPIRGMVHKTLWVEFTSPTAVLSSLEGYRAQVARVGNHYVPRRAWKGLPMHTVPALMKAFWAGLGFDSQDSALLITGADMENLAVGRASQGSLRVVALVSAGVRGNAMRLGFDQGKYLEPGTINVIILTTRRLSPRAMTRAMINVTEAKTAALQDLDIRSRYQPRRYQATGTGTDNIIIVSGQGPPARLSGGHSKLGELMARAVYQAVLKAIARQNQIRPGRDVIARLGERGISLSSLADDRAGAARLRDILSRPFFVSWLEQALALEDAWRRGLLKNLDAWHELCRRANQRAQGGAPRILNQSRGPLAMALAMLKSWGHNRGRED